MTQRLSRIRTLAAVVATLLLLSTMAAPPPNVALAGIATTATPVTIPTPVTDVGPRFVIRPVDGADGDYFTVKAAAGTTTRLVALPANTDDEPLRLRTYANDVIPVVNGGFALAAGDIVPTGTATWLDYPPETFDFGPGKGVERTFTVTIPDDAAPGQYIAGLALETADPAAVEGTDLFNQVIRKAIAVFIIVPGPERLHFGLGAPAFLSGGTVSRIEIPVANDGNVLVKPAGELTLRNLHGRLVLSAPIAMGSIYAGTTAPLSIVLITAIPDGEYRLSVRLTDKATGASASVTDRSIAITSEVATPPQFALAGDISLSPDAVTPLFAEVTLTVTNRGAPVGRTEVLLEVMHDGDAVETFALAPSLALPQGETSVSQRYVPPTGWVPGSWTFRVLLNIIDASTGATTNVATLDSIPAIEVAK